MAVRVQGGVLRYDGWREDFFVVECGNPAHDRCRLTRTAGGAAHSGRSGQGRPYGLLAAWLRAPTASLETNMFAYTSPSRGERQIARRSLATDVDGRALLAAERARRGDESSEEPANVP